MKTIPLLSLIAALSVCSSWAVPTLVGTYTLNYRDNAAGYPDYSTIPEYMRGNPYYLNFIPPGPIFIDAAPGEYEVQVLQNGCSMWNGDANGGDLVQEIASLPNPVRFTHTFGQIVFFYWDWYPWDNDPGNITVLSLYLNSLLPPDDGGEPPDGGNPVLPDGGTIGLLLSATLMGLGALRRCRRNF